MKECKKFAIDLMHLSTNELNEIKDLDKLKAHIKDCADCQKKLKQLIDVDVFTFLARPRSEKYKRGMAELRARIAAESQGAKSCEEAVTPKGKIVSLEELFSGETGTVWETVNKHGIVNFDDLPAKSKLPPGIAYGAMFLLAQKNKLCIIEHKDHIDLFVPK